MPTNAFGRSHIHICMHAFAFGASLPLYHDEQGVPDIHNATGKFPTLLLWRMEPVYPQGTCYIPSLSQALEM